MCLQKIQANFAFWKWQLVETLHRSVGNVAPSFLIQTHFLFQNHTKNFEGPVSVDNITGLFIHIHLFPIFTSIPTSSFLGEKCTADYSSGFYRILKRILLCNTLVSWKTLHPEESSFFSAYRITTLKKLFYRKGRFWHFLLIFFHEILLKIVFWMLEFEKGGDQMK